MARILILGVKVPFTSGGQELMVCKVKEAIANRGHEVDVIEIPFQLVPKEHLMLQIAWWKSLDLRSFANIPTDLVITTKFPSYFAPHPRKSVWLVHQHRAAYDLYGTSYSDFSDDPRDEALRRHIARSDKEVLSSASTGAPTQGLWCISQNVANRLEKYHGITGAKILHPPLPYVNQYHCESYGNYILSVGRIARIKRLDLLVKTLNIIPPEIDILASGVIEDEIFAKELTNLARDLNAEHRFKLLGRTSDEELISLYSNALGVFYAPYDEDFGLAGPEALASQKPLLTTTDSGGVLEFAKEDNSFVVDPDPLQIGQAIYRLAKEEGLAASMGKAGRKIIEQSDLLEQSWDHLVSTLLSPLRACQKTGP